MRNLDQIIELAEHWAKHEPKAAPAELYSLIHDLAEHLKRVEKVRSTRSEVGGSTSNVRFLTSNF